MPPVRKRVVQAGRAASEDAALLSFSNNIRAVPEGEHVFYSIIPQNRARCADLWSSWRKL
jgi:hypothetical protein